MNETYDVMIIGAGLIGTGLAAALKNTSFKIAILETHLPTLSIGEVDSRPLSLAYGSQKILATLGFWQNLAELAEPIQAVHVSEQNHLGVLHFHAAQEGTPALGYVVPFDHLQYQLYQHAAHNPQVKWITIQKLMRVQNSPDQVVVTVQTTEGEKKLTAALLVAADGVHSPTRELLRIPATQEQNDEVALTLGVELAQSHAHTAYERFTREGVIAVLPLKNPQRCRIVWTLPQTLATTVSRWSDTQLGEYLRAAMHDRLGDWRVIERGKAFPLQTVLAQEQVRPGVVLLGNAAHTIYPLAAQGFNLGLRDAVTLSEILVDARNNGQALGSEPILKSYVDWRRSDQRWITGLTSSIGQLFGLRVPGLGVLRGMGLLAADLMPPIKHRLARRLMGLSGKCPKLMRGIGLSSSP